MGSLFQEKSFAFARKWRLVIPLSIYIYIYIYIFVKLVTLVEGDQKAPFPIATKPRCREVRFSFPRIAPLYLCYEPYIAEC